MKLLLFIGLILIAVNATAEPSPRLIANCRTMMMGSPLQIDFFELHNEDGSPTGQGYAQNKNPLLSQLAEMPEAEGLNLMRDRIEIKRPANGELHIAMYPALEVEGEPAFVHFVVPKARMSEIAVRDSLGMLWGNFECIRPQNSICSNLLQ